MSTSVNTPQQKYFNIVIIVDIVNWHTAQFRQYENDLLSIVDTYEIIIKRTIPYHSTKDS